jgi:hypothetical protein
MNRDNTIILIKATLLSVLIFSTISLYTVFNYIRHAGISNLRIGWPFCYYEEFYVDCELHHSTFINSFFMNTALVWCITVLLWFAARYKRN